MDVDSDPIPSDAHRQIWYRATPLIGKLVCDPKSAQIIAQLEALNEEIRELNRKNDRQELDTKPASQIEFEQRLKNAFGELSFKDETLAPRKREWAKTFTGQIIDRKNGKTIKAQGIAESEGGTSTTINLHVDHFRPYLRVAVNLSNDDKGKQKHDDVKKDDPTMIIEACYIYRTLCHQYHKSTNTNKVIRGINITPLRDLTILAEGHRANFGSLHKSTKQYVRQLIKYGKSPVLVDIFHDDDFLDKGVYFGTPTWVVPIAKALKDKKFTRVLIAGYRGTVEVLKVFGKFIARNTSPLARYHLGKKRGAFIKGNLADILELQNTGLQCMYAFYNLAEYATIMWITHTNELEVLRRSITEFEDQTHIIHLVESRVTTPESTYYGFIDIPDSEVFHPRSGDVFKLSFDSEGDFDNCDKKYWPFKVIEPVGLTSQQCISGIVYRPWDREYGVFEADDPNVVTLEKRHSLVEARQLATADVGNKCLLRYIIFNTVDKAIEFFFDQLLWAPKDKAYAAFNERMMKVLLARRIDKFTPHNFFHTPKQSLDLTEVATFMKLDGKQQEAVDALSAAPNGVSITQGPPGTGKTHIISQTCIPFLIMPTPGVHLIVSPSNAGVDDIASSVDKQIRELQRNLGVIAKYPHILDDHNCYVVRLHSKASERAARDLVIYANQTRPDDACPPMFTGELDEMMQDLSETEKILCEILRKSTEASTPGINDPRMKHYSLSAGARMLQSLGLWPNGQGGFVPASLDAAKSQRSQTGGSTTHGIWKGSTKPFLTDHSTGASSGWNYCRRFHRGQS